jgi:hypothetical protein
MVDSKGPNPSQPPSRAVEKAAPNSPATATPEAKPAPTPAPAAKPVPASAESKPLPAPPARKPEIGGPKGPEPTRYGDWEKGGRCIDF